MQRFVVIAVKDTGSQLFLRPQYVPATQAGVRAFGDVINDGQSEYAKHPDDYELYELGYFYDGTGKYEIHPEPKLVVRGKDLVRG